MNPGLHLAHPGAALSVLSHSICQEGNRKLLLSARSLLASNLHGGITEVLTQQGGKVFAPSSATLRPRLLWADGWGFYSVTLPLAAGYMGRSSGWYEEPA